MRDAVRARCMPAQHGRRQANGCTARIFQACRTLHRSLTGEMPIWLTDHSLGSGRNRFGMDLTCGFIGRLSCKNAPQAENISKYGVDLCCQWDVQIGAVQCFSDLCRTIHKGYQEIQKLKHWLHSKDVLFLHACFQVTCELHSI
jgi:hypothetical protein